MQSWLLRAIYILYETSVRYSTKTVLTPRESMCRVGHVQLTPGR